MTHGNVSTARSSCEVCLRTDVEVRPASQAPNRLICVDAFTCFAEWVRRWAAKR